MFVMKTQFRVIRINTCLMCPFHSKSYGELSCKMMNYQIIARPINDYNNTTPKWCPLPLEDYE